MQTSVLQNTYLNSPLAQQSGMRPKGKSAKRTLAYSLGLTSLVDAFTILVIYLLVNTTGAQELDLSNKVQIPTAQYASTLKNAPLIRLEGQNFIFEKQAYSASQLQSLLNTISQKQSSLVGEPIKVVIEADKSAKFNALNPLLVAAAEQGVQTFQFAVIHNGAE